MGTPDFQQPPMERASASHLRERILAAAHNAAVPIRAIEDAIELASMVHRHDTRSEFAGEAPVPYIVHPLRCALRALHCGSTDEDVVVAAVLHDTVEDHADELAAMLDAEPAGDAHGLRAQALHYLATRFGARVSAIVDALSNPIAVKGLSREAANELYRNHVAAAIRDVAVFIVKVSDFQDNAGNLHVSITVDTPHVARRRAVKYLPLVSVLVGRAERDDVMPHMGFAARASTVSRLREIEGQLVGLTRM